MIIGYILLCALVASPALGSAIKGREDIKGDKQLASPIEQQKLIVAAELQTKGSKLEHVQKLEQREEIAEHKIEELQQQKEEVKLEESKGKRYEARPQINLEETLNKVQRIEQREELSLGKTSKLERQKQEDRLEQHELQQQRELDTQQIELKEEPQRLEEPLLVQQQVQISDVSREGTKSAYGGAPIGMAEPYAFSYQIEGSSRSESSDANGVVRGQYTLQGADGSSRIVDYIADHNGFRAKVNTNEFGTETRSPANVALQSSQPLAESITLRAESKSRGELKPTSVGELKGYEVQKPLALESKGTRKVIEEARAPTKSIKQESLSQKLVQEERPVEPQLIEKLDPIKTESRAPKSLPSELKSAELRSGFTSATAHRQLSPARIQTVGQRAQVHPLSPAQSHKRGPRVSFYAPGNTEEDSPGFDPPLVQPLH